MKRFWKEVGIANIDNGWQVTLDSRGIRTQGKRAQVVPGKALAELLASEWQAQGDTLDPSGFSHRDMADYAIDMIASGEEDIAAKLMAYFETDTLCYRADPDEPLYKRQLEIWEPLLMAFESREGVSIERASGILHKAQPDATLVAIRSTLEALGPLELAALFALTSLAASLVIGLSALEEDANPDALWNAANLEEDWQVELWGYDAEASERRARRLEDFRRAHAFAMAARS